ncbi:MAG: ABC transporter permease [Acidobacteria bacterium]|nr:ABC transporter permease [Acidobacteriota bacterium]
MQDLRYALRMFRRNWGFTLTAVMVMALSICATVAIFSAVNAIILRPLPYHNSERLVTVWGTQPKVPKVPTSPAEFLDWKTQTTTFDAMAAFSGQSFNLTGAGEPERIEGAVVSPGFFQVLEMQPLLGRSFNESDEQGSGNRLALISEGLWRRRFGGDNTIIGSRLLLNDESFEVVGVMAQDFQFPERVDLWVGPKQIVPEPPVRLPGNILEMRNVRYLGTVARLKPGVKLPQAQADMSAIAARLAQQYPATNEQHEVKLVALKEEIVGNVKPVLFMLLGATVLVLLTSCSNVGNLLLGRALARRKEISTRLALGASRLRIAQQVLTESVLLSLIAGGLGLLLARWAIKALIAIGPTNIPRATQISIDGTVLLVTLLISVLTGISFGLVPALQTRTRHLTEVLNQGARGSSSGPGQHRVRSALVVSQVALSFALLICGGLMFKSFYRLQNVNLGFDPDSVLTMQIALPRAKYVDPNQVTGFYEQALQRLSSLPGVKSVGAISKLPLTGTGVSGGIVIEGRPVNPSEELRTERRIVTEDYFRAMSVPLKSGRFFNANDRSNPKVVLINETTAKRYWNGEEPVGRRIRFPEDKDKWLEVVGVVGDVRQSSIEAEPKPELYIPYFQSPSNNMTVVAKMNAGGTGSAASFRSEVTAVDRSQPVYNIRTMGQVVDEALAQARFSVVLLGIFAATGLLLAVVGLYGVMTTAVAQRTHEIGIRMAIGARPATIVKLILVQGAIPVLLGLSLGLFLAFALTRSLSSLLFTVPSADVSTYLFVSAFFLLLMFVANLIPAYRASKLSPVLAIREP